MSKDAPEAKSDEDALALIRSLAARGRVTVKREARAVVEAVIKDYETLGPWIEKVLDAAGIKQQFIHDRMAISDFMDRRTAVARCQELSGKLGVPVEPTSTFVEIARILRSKTEGKLV